ncbi:alpha/beta hydrolase [Kitasatospora sp. NPDC096147]|uniref:alpha/beta hydrolase n=1 Tax=Kitasatospora sp. NPDC096147 TaxID=3364093 RepID=UPI0037F64F2B
MHFSSEQRLDGGVLERDFTLGGIPGTLWTPEPAPNPTAAPTPLILLGHPGDLGRMRPRLLGRAAQAAADGFATATIELPGAGERPRLPALERARTELRRTMQAGETVGPDVIDALVLPLVDAAVPEWQAVLDALLALPGLGGPVGFSGGVIAVVTRLAVVEPRLTAAVLFAGSFVPAATLAEARRVTVPLHVLLQWDDAGNDRQASLDLFDAFGSAEKTLTANLGGHTGVPQHAGDAAAAFFRRHLR